MFSIYVPSKGNIPTIELRRALNEEKQTELILKSRTSINFMKNRAGQESSARSGSRAKTSGQSTQVEAQDADK
ncbi:hypothetical protein BGZ58_008073, partial [Dissophora ornata]